jgi:putative Mn2+ efflux pump MntP
LLYIWEGVALALACSVDSFAAGFAYGGKGVQIPWRSGLLLAFICTVFLGVSLWLGGAVRQFIPGWLTVAVCFAILFILGVVKLLDSILRRTPKEGGADKNKDKIISPAEASVLAVALSLDGLAVGFGAGVGLADIWATVTASLVIGTAAIMGGVRLGNKFCRTAPFNMSWISGVILIALAVLRLV